MRTSNYYNDKSKSAFDGVHVIVISRCYKKKRIGVVSWFNFCGFKNKTEEIRRILQKNMYGNVFNAMPHGKLDIYLRMSLKETSNKTFSCFQINLTLTCQKYFPLSFFKRTFIARICFSDRYPGSQHYMSP